jgi:hypothetical protein
MRELSGGQTSLVFACQSCRLPKLLLLTALEAVPNLLMPCRSASTLMMSFARGRACFGPERLAVDPGFHLLLSRALSAA